MPMLTPYNVVQALDLSNPNDIMTFLSGIEEQHNIKLIVESEERIMNAGKYRHSIKFKYVSIEAYDQHSALIKKYIETYLKSNYDDLVTKSNSKDKVNVRVSAAFGAAMLENSELFDTLDLVFKKNKQVEFSSSVYIVFKQLLTKQLLMKSFPVEVKVQKKKRFLFF